MHLFEEKHLAVLVRDPDIFSIFNLSLREQQIVHMHLLKGYTFQFIGGVFRISRQMVHKIYTRCLEKIRKRIFEILRWFVEWVNGKA